MSEPRPFDEVVIDGATVRIVLRDVGEIFGDVMPRLRDGRRPIALWGCGRTICVASEDVESAEPVKLTREHVLEIAQRQHSKFPEGSTMRFQRRGR